LKLTGWEFRVASQAGTESKVYASPAVDDNPTPIYVYIGNEEKVIYRAKLAENPPSATAFYHADTLIRNAVLPIKDTVFFHTSYFVRGMDINGALIKTYTNDSKNGFDTDITPSDPDLYSDAKETWLYLGSTDGYLYSLNPKAMNNLVSRFFVGKMVVNPGSGTEQQVYGSPVVDEKNGGTVYAACTTPKAGGSDPAASSRCALNALSPGKLELLWSFTAEEDSLQNFFVSSPVIADELQQVYVVSAKGELFSLNASRSQ
jgi:outer membrane protein assembly factor BamB